VPATDSIQAVKARCRAGSGQAMVAGWLVRVAVMGSASIDGFD
jgi:hypothetical protein